MRLFEIASAEEQMALLKLIMDKTWEALTTQQRQQAQQKAATKPKQVKARTPKVPYASPPPKLPTPRTQVPRINAPIMQKTVPVPLEPAKLPTSGKSFPTPPKASFDSKDRFLQQRSSASDKQDEKEGRHS